MIIDITYKNGRGHMKTDLSVILPASASDFRRLLDFVQLSDDPEKHAAGIHDFICGAVQDLQRLRACCNEQADAGKIADFNQEIKRFCANDTALVKVYGFDAVTDSSAQIALKAGPVYIRVVNRGKVAADVRDGWTFEKAGFLFAVHKEKAGRFTRFIVSHYQTGMNVAETDKKKLVPGLITPRIVELLNKEPEKLQQYAAELEELKRAAGLVNSAAPAPAPAAPVAADPAPAPIRKRRPARKPAPVAAAPAPAADPAPAPAAPVVVAPAPAPVENITAKKGLKNMFAFTPDTVTVGGETFPAEYKIIDAGQVLVFAIVGEKTNGRKTKMRFLFAAGDPGYKEALQAAGGTYEEPEDDCIHGNGWRILFDQATSRTRVIFVENPAPAALEAVNAAGFYFSRVMNSYNKKLTVKARRAAEKLAADLEKVYAG